MARIEDVDETHYTESDYYCETCYISLDERQMAYHEQFGHTITKGYL